MSTQTSPPRARRDIQGLRAVAVVAVVLCHAIGWPSGGFVGVDVFFVVSGFLITGLLLREVDRTGRISLGGFYARRIRRILPAALLVLVAVAVAAFFVFNRARADQTLGDAVAAFLLVSNWRFAAEGTDYFHATDAASPLQHFWSLSVEEQFYLVWPGLLLLLLLLLPLARRRGRGARLLVGLTGVLLAAASFGWAMVQTSTEPTVAYFSTATRVWELAVGAILAALTPLLARIPAALRILAGWVGLAGVLWSFVVIDPDSAFPAPWAALPVAATALVIMGGVGGDPRARHLFPLTNPVSVFVGDMSYSLYLWHFPVIVFAAVLLPIGAPVTPIVLGAIAVLSLASYLMLEQPLHRSPWLRPLSRSTAAPLVDVPAAEPAPSAPPRRELASRPAGWTPGQRYYPGAPRPTAPLALEAASAPAAPAVETAAVDEIAPVTTAAGPVATRAAAAVDAPERPLSAEERRAARRAAWAAWRARFGAQIGLSATGLAVGAGVLVLVLQTTVGGPVLGPLIPDDTSSTQAAPADPTPALQDELAAAASATAWPALNPSLDDAIVRSSSNNPARDCFAPDVPIDAGRCTWGSAEAPNHMYLVGDSTAMAYAPAFKKIAEDSGGAWRITTVGMYGCRFTDVLVQNDGAGVMAACPQRKLDVRAMIAADPPQWVVVSNAYTLGHTVDGTDLSASALLAATQAEMSAYGAAGRIVYLAPPPLGADLGTCYSPLATPANCLSSVDGTWRDMEVAAEVTAAASGDHAVSSLPFSCWQDVCPAFAGTLPTKYDQTHLTVPFAEHIAPAVRWALAAQGVF